MARSQCRRSGWAAALSITLAACKPTPAARHSNPAGDPSAGLIAIRNAGCAACHAVPGIDWPQGRMGPALTAFGARTTIAGVMPNRPDLLAVWLRNAPRLKPGTTMPAIPLDEKAARDAAAYLLTLDAR